MLSELSIQQLKEISGIELPACAGSHCRAVRAGRLLQAEPAMRDQSLRAEQPAVSCDEEISFARRGGDARGSGDSEIEQLIGEKILFLKNAQRLGSKIKAFQKAKLQIGRKGQESGERFARKAAAHLKT